MKNNMKVEITDPNYDKEGRRKQEEMAKFRADRGMKKWQESKNKANYVEALNHDRKRQGMPLMTKNQIDFLKNKKNKGQIVKKTLDKFQ